MYEAGFYIYEIKPIKKKQTLAFTSLVNIDAKYIDMEIKKKREIKKQRLFMIKTILILMSTLLVFAACQKKEIPSRCFEKPKVGFCRAAFTKYYFDNNSNSCKEFIWGGCKGFVPFNSKKECISSCVEN